MDNSIPQLSAQERPEPELPHGISKERAANQFIPNARTATKWMLGPRLGIKFIQLNFFFSSAAMDQLLVKNTFIQVKDVLDDSAKQADLPRAYSDQSHVRKARDNVATVITAFPGIPEDSDDTISEKASNIQRLDTEELERLRTLSRPTFESNFGPLVQPPLLGMLETIPRAHHLQSDLSPSSILVTHHQETQIPIGDHKWHEESLTMGKLDYSKKEFTKLEFDGRLSMVTESLVHHAGCIRYVVSIVSGPISVADGFGFVFSSSLPCKKNIQKIESVFLNRKGRICSRTGNELEILNGSSIGSLEVGTIVEIIVNLESLEVSFGLFSPPRGLDAETLSILVRDERTFSNWLVGSAQVSLKGVLAKTDHLNSPAGHFCAVLKNRNTTVRFL
jgi:hypothetical protein